MPFRGPLARGPFFYFLMPPRITDFIVFAEWGFEVLLKTLRSLDFESLERRILAPCLSKVCQWAL